SWWGRGRRSGAGKWPASVLLPAQSAQRRAEPQNGGAFPGGGAICVVLRHYFAAEAALELIDAELGGVFTAGIPAAKIVDGQTFVAETLDVGPVLQTVGASDEVGRGLIELAEDRGGVQQANTLAAADVGVPCEHLAIGREDAGKIENVVAVHGA